MTLFRNSLYILTGTFLQDARLYYALPPYTICSLLSNYKMYWRTVDKLTPCDTPVFLVSRVTSYLARIFSISFSRLRLLPTLFVVNIFVSAYPDVRWEQRLLFTRLSVENFKVWVYQRAIVYQVFRSVLYLVLLLVRYLPCNHSTNILGVTNRYPPLVIVKSLLGIDRRLRQLYAYWSIGYRTTNQNLSVRQ